MPNLFCESPACHWAAPLWNSICQAGIFFAAPFCAMVMVTRKVWRIGRLPFNRNEMLRRLEASWKSRSLARRHLDAVVRGYWESTPRDT
jgi:hypothetical protein